ncbi:MAG TPA: ribose 5-phosphate isomerase B [Desulfuromonadales bacterium]|nr:ribose 5-phosphate isomerase B [Desulfuromonadales bacterium]
MFYIASDHGALELKKSVIDALEERGLDYRDLGTDNGDSVDYPDFAEKVGRAISLGEAHHGILMCGTGIGMSIVANKFPGVRAALVTDENTARMSRLHNNANVLVMGGRVVDLEHGKKLLEIWLDTEFEGGRHSRRLEKIAAIENEIRKGQL